MTDTTEPPRGANFAKTPSRAQRASARAFVLVVDDSDELRDALCTLLSARGYAVRGCRHGAEALACLKQPVLPDVIILDLIMPEMNGWEFRVQQRRDVRIAQIPVVALSGDDSAQARAMDVSAYLHKPLDVAELLQTLEALLQRPAIQQPRSLEQEQSAQLESIFTMCQRVRETLTGEQLRLVGQGELGEVAHWVHWVGTRRVVWSDGFARLLGLPMGRHTPSCEALRDLVHQQDRARVMQAVEAAMAARTAFSEPCRITRVDGAQLQVLLLGEPVLDELGRVCSYAGSVIELRAKSSGDASGARR